MGMRKNRKRLNLIAIALVSLYLIIGLPKPAYAMHIMEGFLPPGWAAFWWVVSLPFMILGFLSLAKITKEKPHLTLL